MDLPTLELYLAQYGMLALFIIVFLEYLNLPGFPAGIIMPLSGIWAQQFNKNFLFVLLISVIAGVLGSWMLYFVGFFLGNPILNWFRSKFKRQAVALDKAILQINERGYVGLLLAKLLPTVRTIISIPAGTIRMNFLGYTFYSAIGITIWNGVLVGLGYLFGHTALNWISNL